MAAKLTPEERANIISLLHEHGGNQNRVAKMVGRAQPTVRRIAIAEGIESINTSAKRAREAKRNFEEIDAYEFVASGVRKGQDLLTAIDNAPDWQKWTVGAGTLVDKLLLLKGKPTNINESRKGSTLSDLFGDVDEEARREWEQTVYDGDTP